MIFEGQYSCIYIRRRNFVADRINYFLSICMSKLSGHNLICSTINSCQLINLLTESLFDYTKLFRVTFWGHPNSHINSCSAHCFGLEFILCSVLVVNLFLVNFHSYGSNWILCFFECEECSRVWYRGRSRRNFTVEILHTVPQHNLCILFWSS